MVAAFSREVEVGAVAPSTRAGADGQDALSAVHCGMQRTCRGGQLISARGQLVGAAGREGHEDPLNPIKFFLKIRVWEAPPSARTLCCVTLQINILNK